MKKKDVQIGAVYTAKISGKLTKVRIERPISWGVNSGWEATNLTTGRSVRIKTAAKLRNIVIERTN